MITKIYLTINILTLFELLISKLKVMKRILLVLLIVISSNFIIAQDIIMKKNGDEIKSKVIEITLDFIKYKEFEFQDGPTRNIKISEVFMIIYENGKKEKFVTTQKKSPDEISIEEDSDDEIVKDKYKGKYFMIGTGYGNSYGGAGILAQLRFGGNVGFGVHAGVGYFPDAPVLASAGFKFYPYKGLYIDAQFGLTGYEYYSEYGYYGHYYDEHILYGPSMLAGAEWTWGKKVGFGFNAAAGITYNINVDYFEPITLAIDLGFVVRF